MPHRTNGLAAATLIAATVFVTSACSRPPRYVVGVVVDQTGSTSAIGRAVEFGARYQADLIRDIPITVRTEDDRNDPFRARQQAFRLTLDGDVVAVIGHASSGTTRPATEVLGRFGIPLLMPVATSTSISADAFKAGWRNVLRLVPTNDLQALAITEFLLTKLSCTQPYLLYDKTDYGKDLADKLNVVFRSRDITVTPAVYPGSVEIAQHLEGIKRFQASCIVFAGYYSDASRLVQQLRAAQFEDPIVLTDGSFQAELFHDIGANIDNLFVSFVAPDWSSVSSAGPLLDAYRRAYPEADATAASYAPFGADAVAMIADAIRRSRPPTTARAVLEELRKPGLTFRGIAGEYRFDEKGDSLTGRYHIYRVAFEHDRNRFLCETCEPRR